MAAIRESAINGQYLWRSHNLKPHQTEDFKLSRDPKFLEKLTDRSGPLSEPARQSHRPLYR